MRSDDLDHGNLWLARALWDAGAVQFGDFNIGATVASPIYVNVRRLVSNPRALLRIGQLLTEETRTLRGMLHPQISPFELTAGVPMGGLHIATAFSLSARVPLIYPNPRAREHEVYEEIEGVYVPGQTVLLVDDLITGGSSVVEAAEMLRAAGLLTLDAVVLLDRQAGGGRRLEEQGITLRPLLTLEVLVNYLASHDLITQAQYTQALAYIAQTSGE